MITTDRNREGAWRCSAFVTDGRDEWLETMTFYDYTKREAISLYRQTTKAKGWSLS